MDNELLELRDVNVSFLTKSRLLEGEKRLKVLRDVNLKINEGEIAVIVGESGCGKTTIGKIITGLLNPTSGKLLFYGRSVYRNIFNKSEKATLDSADIEKETINLSKKEKAAFIKAAEKKAKIKELERFKEFSNSVQFVQQDSYAALNPARTIYQSLFAPIKSKNKKMTKLEIEERIDELLKMVGLYPSEQYLFKFPHQLSGGQRQRILMARAVSLNPKLIVADEPVSMIDVSLRLSILDLMKDLNKNLNISFVYITHDLATARYIGYNGKICVMYLGEIVETGAVEEVVKNPKHPYTQALLSAVPIPDPVISRNAKPINIKSMEVGSLIDRKDGCAFFKRCPYSRSECENNKVQYEEKNGTKVLCSNLSEVAAWEQKD